MKYQVLHYEDSLGGTYANGPLVMAEADTFKSAFHQYKSHGSHGSIRHESGAEYHPEEGIWLNSSGEEMAQPTE